MEQKTVVHSEFYVHCVRANLWGSNRRVKTAVSHVNYELTHTHTHSVHQRIMKSRTGGASTVKSVCTNQSQSEPVRSSVWRLSTVEPALFRRRSFLAWQSEALECEGSMKTFPSACFFEQPMVANITLQQTSVTSWRWIQSDGIPNVEVVEYTPWQMSVLITRRYSVELASQLATELCFLSVFCQTLIFSAV